MGDDRIAGCAYSANSAKAYCDFLLTGIYIAGHEEKHKESSQWVLFFSKPLVSSVVKKLINQGID